MKRMPLTLTTSAVITSTLWRSRFMTGSLRGLFAGSLTMNVDADAGRAVQTELSAVGADDVAADRQPQPRARATRGAGLVEPLEEARSLGVGHAHARVAHEDPAGGAVAGRVPGRPFRRRGCT